MSTLHEREDEIFGKYLKQGFRIIPDGALGTEYEAVRPKLLVILKEPNDADGEFQANGGDIRDFGTEKYYRWQTWNNLARWSALVNNPKIDIEKIDISNSMKRREHLRRIAVCNLKKTSGQSTSRNAEIKKSAEQHKELLQEQFHLYKPDITISGGSCIFPIVRDMLGKKEVKDKGKCFPYFKDTDLGLCFDFYHPLTRTLSTSALLNLLRRELKYHGF